MQLVVAEVESRNESRCPLLRAKVKLAGIVTTLKSDPGLNCCASASLDLDPVTPSGVLLPRSTPESCRPQAPLAACCSVTFRPVLKTPSSAGEHLLLGARVGIYSGRCVDSGSACAPAHVLPPLNNRYSVFWILLLSFGVCMHACACVSWCTCGARGQLVGVGFSFCHVRILE